MCRCDLKLPGTSKNQLLRAHENLNTSVDQPNFRVIQLIFQQK